MKARDMQRGSLYLDKGTVINLHFHGPKYSIVSEPGDLDMQSQWGILLDAEVTPVSRHSIDGKCPVCLSDVQPTNNPDNPEVRKWKFWCSNTDCAWVGN